MVRHAILLLGLLSGCTPNATGRSGARATDSAAAQVTIEHNGAWSDAVSGDETAAQCRRFQLTAADVQTYFDKAQPVDGQAFNHDLDMSRCYASGKIRFGDGRRGDWFIDLERRGSLTLADGTIHYLYCLACTSPKFDTLDDETIENARALIKATKAK